MNFQYLDQNTGQKFDVSLNVIAVGQTKTVGTKQTQLQECTLQEPGGRTEAATLFLSQSPALNNSHVGQTLIFKLSHSVYQGKNQYAGYWQCPNPQENQQPSQAQQAPSQNQQQAQAPPQQQNYQAPAQTPPPQQQQPQGEPQRNMTYAYEVTPGVAARITRSVALEAASRLMLGKSDCSPQDVLSMAISLYEWVATGEIPMSPAQQPGTDQGSDDKDIPF